jgi:hypothetical protein
LQPFEGVVSLGPQAAVRGQRIVDIGEDGLDAFELRGGAFR